MKAVTEFASFTINQAVQAKTALAAEGKTPEEISEGLGQKFKYEGEKLTHLMNAIEAAGENREGLKRVMVMSAAEGEKVPPKAKQVGEHVYVPEMHVTVKAAPAKDDKKGGRGGRDGGRDGGKGGGGGKGDKKHEGKWGLSPEELAAKKKGPQKA